MTTFMLAWHRTMRTPATTSTERRAHYLRLVLSCLHLHAHMHLGSSLSLSCHLHGHPRVCGLFTLILPFYFLLYLPSLFLFLNYLKSVVNLRNSCNESMDSTDEFSLSTTTTAKEQVAKRRQGSNKDTKTANKENIDDLEALIRRI